MSVAPRSCRPGDGDDSADDYSDDYQFESSLDSSVELVPEHDTRVLADPSLNNGKVSFPAAADAAPKVQSPSQCCAFKHGEEESGDDKHTASQQRKEAEYSYPDECKYEADNYSADAKESCRSVTCNGETKEACTYEMVESEERRRIKSETFITINNMQLTKTEATCLYGIESSKEDPSKFIIPRKIKPKETKRVLMSQERIDELSKPREYNPERIKFAKESEVKNCTFRPKRSTKALKCGYDFAERTEGGENFLDRMEAMEKHRRQKMERDKMEAKYNATVGKKQCPNCGSYQSFDEMIENRTNCPNDTCAAGFEYCHLKKFVLKRFEERMCKSSKTRQETIAKIEEELVRTRKQSKVRKGKTQKELLRKVSDTRDKSFLNRMSEDIASRKERLSQLEQSLRQVEEKECTFQPHVHIPNRLLRARQTDPAVLAEPKHRKTKERASEMKNTRANNNTRRRTTRREKRSATRKRRSQKTTKPRTKPTKPTQKKEECDHVVMARKFQQLLM